MNKKKISLAIKTPRKDTTLVIRWLLTGVSLAFLLAWVTNGGFNYFTESECIVILVTIGTTYGMWVEHWLQ